MKEEVGDLEIYGLQKLTLLDYPGKVACTVFTGGCDFRCPFCHNASLVIEPERGQRVSEDEVLKYLSKRKGIIDGVCITGGEPLLQPDIDEFLKKVRAIGYDIKLDTNGSFPDKLKRLVEDKLVDYVAMDLKSSKENYGKVIGIEGYDTARVEESVNYLMKSGIDYEFRTTAVKSLHDIGEFEKMAEWIRGAKHYYIQNFVDSGELIGKNMEGFSKSDMNNILEMVKKYLPNAELRGV